MENEIWKDIEGYEGLYQVSNLGRVKSLARKTGNQYNKENILSKERTRKGYYRVQLTKNKEHKHYPIHRLVAIAFIPNPDNLPCVNHKDENKGNNCVYNLEWCDTFYNNNFGTRTERANDTKKLVIVQYDLNGNVVNSNWQCAREIAETLGYNEANIRNSCRTKKAYRGYIWRYKEKEVA